MKKTAYTETDGLHGAVTLEDSVVSHPPRTSMVEYYKRFLAVSSSLPASIPEERFEKTTYLTNQQKGIKYNTAIRHMNTGQRLTSSMENLISTVKLDTSSYLTTSGMSTASSGMHPGYIFAGVGYDMDMRTENPRSVNRDALQTSQQTGNVTPQLVFGFPTARESFSKDLISYFGVRYTEASTAQERIYKVKSTLSVGKKNSRINKVVPRQQHVTAYENMKKRTYNSLLDVFPNNSFDSITEEMSIKVVTSQVYIYQSSEYATSVADDKVASLAHESTASSTNEIRMVMNDI